MIGLTKLNGVEFVLNCDLIEHISENPDTTILLTTGTLYIVKESADEVVRRVIEFRKQVFSNLLVKKDG